MKLTEEYLRNHIRNALIKVQRKQINEGLFDGSITISVNDPYAFTSKTVDNGRRSVYVHQINDRFASMNKIVRKIAKAFKKIQKLKEYTLDEKSVTKVVKTILNKAFVKDTDGKKENIGKSSNESIRRIAYTYERFGVRFFENGFEDYSNAVTLADIDVMEKFPSNKEFSLDSPPPKGRGKALVDKDPSNKLKGKKIVTTGIDKGADIVILDIGGSPVPLTQLFDDILQGEKLLKQGMGGKGKENSLEYMQIKGLQGLLINMNGSPAKGLFTKPDGDYGSKTKEAVKNMQRMLKLTVDGKVGQQTASALNPKVTGKNVPITGSGKLPPDVAKKIGLKTKLKMDPPTVTKK